MNRRTVPRAGPPATRTVARWEGDRFLVDRRFLAALLGVSVRTVRRYCTPTDIDQPTGVVLYDAMAAQDTLAGVVARPQRTATATRVRVAAAAAAARRPPTQE